MRQSEESNERIIIRYIEMMRFVVRILFLRSESQLPHKYSDRTDKKSSSEDVSPHYQEDWDHWRGRPQGSEYKTKKFGLSSKASIMWEMIPRNGKFTKLYEKQIQKLKKMFWYETVCGVVKQVKMPPRKHKIRYPNVQKPNRWQYLASSVKSCIRIMRHSMCALAKSCADTAHRWMYALVRRILVWLDSQLSDCMPYPAKTKRELMEALVLEKCQTQTKQPSQAPFYASMLVMMGIMCAIVTHAILNAGYLP